MDTNSNYGRISLSLMNEGKEPLKTYRMVEYDHHVFNAWRAYSHLGVNFGYCFMKNGNLCVARNKAGKYWLVKLQSLTCY
jgi:hypothetical protein